MRKRCRNNQKEGYLLQGWELLFCFNVLKPKYYIAAWPTDYPLARGDYQILLTMNIHVVATMLMGPKVMTTARKKEIYILLSLPG